MALNNKTKNLINNRFLQSNKNKTAWQNKGVNSPHKVNKNSQSFKQKIRGQQKKASRTEKKQKNKKLIKKFSIAGYRRRSRTRQIRKRGRIVNTRPEYFWRKAAPFILESRRLRREYRKIQKKAQRQAVQEKDKIVKLTNNIIFFRKNDGVYSSYWVGKLIGMLSKEGKKKRASRSIYKAFAILKYKFQQNPLLMLIELLDKVKPAFKLRQYRFRRGRKFLNKEYPSVVVREKRYRLALLWLYANMIKDDAFFGAKLPEKIFYKIADFVSSPRRNALIKIRKNYMKRIMWGQFNMRFNWRKTR